MSILISGSFAYDYIMDFPDSFKHHILPDQIHILNVGFVVEKLQKNFGGTGGNIAYTMKLLGGEPILRTIAGNDAKEYLEYLEYHNIKIQYIYVDTKTLTASAYITTDKDDNQITAFYPGPNIDVAALSLHDIEESLTFGIIAPATKKEIMLRHAKECYEKKIPFVFDPGQQVTAFSAQELMQIIGQSAFVIGNDYEMRLIENKTGWNTMELLNHTHTVIITLGERGSIIRTKDDVFEIAPCPPLSVEDPTGAGDAYRAGFFFAYSTGTDLETCGQVGSVAATYAVEHYGTQNHSFTKETFGQRFQDVYNKPLPFMGGK